MTTKLYSTSTSRPRHYRSSKTELPDNFKPSELTVLIGRGKMCLQAKGNHRLRTMVQAHRVEYSNATTKQDKSTIVCTIIDLVYDSSLRTNEYYYCEAVDCCDSSTIAAAGAGGGGAMFVKYDTMKEIWYEVSTNEAREKVSSMFRDVLSQKYKSSAKSKVARRKQERTELLRRVHNNIKRCSMVSIDDSTTSNNSCGIFGDDSDDDNDDSNNIEATTSMSLPIITTMKMPLPSMSLLSKKIINANDSPLKIKSHTSYSNISGSNNMILPTRFNSSTSSASRQITPIPDMILSTSPSLIEDMFVAQQQDDDMEGNNNDYFDNCKPIPLNSMSSACIMDKLCELHCYKEISHFEQQQENNNESSSKKIEEEKDYDEDDYVLMLNDTTILRQSSSSWFL